MLYTPFINRETIIIISLISQHGSGNKCHKHRVFGTRSTVATQKLTKLISWAIAVGGTDFKWEARDVPQSEEHCSRWKRRRFQYSLDATGDSNMSFSIICPIARVSEGRLRKN